MKSIGIENSRHFQVGEYMLRLQLHKLYAPKCNTANMDE